MRDVQMPRVALRAGGAKRTKNDLWIPPGAETGNNADGEWKTLHSEPLVEGGDDLMNVLEVDGERISVRCESLLFQGSIETGSMRVEFGVDCIAAGTGEHRTIAAADFNAQSDHNVEYIQTTLRSVLPEHLR